LYENFFRIAFPGISKKMGVVYTPVEIVDFMIYSIEDILKKEFNRSMNDENVHILDPFTGTGTFITRLLQSNIIKKEDLYRKYTSEIHANEIILLAYYIASINIESVYHELLQNGQNINNTRLKYTSFPGICFTDTYQLGETIEGENLFSEIFPQNSERVIRQKNTPLRIIFGNPPYSKGQESANDNAQNQKYEKLDRRIELTYVANSNANNKNSLYNTYIKAFRWSADRLDPVNGGIICFVSNGAWLDGLAGDGFRYCLEKEFTSIYVFNLRGNCLTSGDLRKNEGGNVFGSGTRNPISITLLVKNPIKKTKKASIYYYDIGDCLTRENKLKIIKDFASIVNIPWKIISPDKHNDWINFRNDNFFKYINFGNKDKKSEIEQTYFNSKYSRGVATARDHFCWNFSKVSLEKNIKTIINFYNEQCKEYHIAKEKNKKIKLKDFVNYDSTKITWNDGFKQDLEKGVKFRYNDENIYQGMYRPFCKQYVYFAKELNDRTYQMPQIFPTKKHYNLIICIPGIGDKKDFSVLVSDYIPDLGLFSSCQCFPLYWYIKKDKNQSNLFENSDDEYIRQDGISDYIFKQAKDKYGLKTTKEDIFYYIYGILHKPDYRIMYANDLKKMLPRLPLIDNSDDFWKFSKAGRELAKLHLNYEKQEPFNNLLINGKQLSKIQISKDQLFVDKMKFPAKNQKTSIIYNKHLTISNIPDKAYDYIINGKSAIRWIMEYYSITIHKESGLKNDPNNWGIEHNNPQYILNLLLSIINVSVKTVNIVETLPDVNWNN